jgi:hypothetical protein
MHMISNMDDVAFLNELMVYTSPNKIGYKSNLWNKLEELSHSFNLDVVYTEVADPLYLYGYDKNTIRIEKDERAGCDLAHELSHWIVCEPKRRNKPEFGLGCGFSTRDRNIKAAVSKKIAQFEEDCACILAFILLKKYNVDVKNEARLTEFLYAPNTTNDNINKVFSKLREWRIINKEREYTRLYR